MGETSKNLLKQNLFENPIMMPNILCTVIKQDWNAGRSRRRGKLQSGSNALHEGEEIFKN